MKNYDFLEIAAKAFIEKRNIESKDIIQIESSLTEIFLSTQDEWQTGFKYMLSLPINPGIKGFINAWEQMDESRRNTLVMSLIKYPDFGMEVRRKLKIIKWLLSKGAAAGMFVFVDLCKYFTEECSKLPEENYIKMIIAEKLIDNLIKNISLKEFKFNQKDAGAFKITFLNVLVSEPSSVLISEDLEWLKVLPTTPVKKRLFTDISSKIEDWSDLNKEIVYSIIKPVANTKKTKKTEINEGQRENRTEIKPTVKKNDFDAIKSLEEVLKYIEKIQEENRQFKMRINNLEIKINQEKDSKKLTEEKVREISDVLNLAEEKNGILIKELDKVKHKNALLNETIVQKEKEHEEQITKLAEMSGQESNYRVEEFKNKLVRILRIEYEDFKAIENDSVTVELGENLRAQISGIFQRLNREGIAF